MLKDYNETCYDSARHELHLTL